MQAPTVLEPDVPCGAAAGPCPRMDQSAGKHRSTRLRHGAPWLKTVLVRPANLPEEWQGYSPLHALLWLDGDVSDLRSPSQMQAIKTWISAGGRLIVEERWVVVRRGLGRGARGR